MKKETLYQPLIHQPKPLKELSWEEAQSYCNFILCKPQDEFLKKFKVIETSFRTESSTDFASHRCVLQSSNVVLSVKQFLYDWAPPAYDHPSLWRNTEISPQELTPIPKPLLIGSQVAWVGLNFRRQQAATLSIMRTMIEITIVAGSVKNEDFIELFNALKPTDSMVAEKINVTPFSMLTHMWRQKRNASPVPLSYWKYTRSDQASYTAHHPQDIAHNGIPEKIFDGYELNSIFLIKEDDLTSEVEYYYEHTKYPGAYIRLLVISSNAPFLKKLDDQFCFLENLMIEGHSLGYAYLTKEFGPHEAIWTKDKIYLILTKPMAWTTRSWFLDNVKEVFKLSHSL